MVIATFEELSFIYILLITTPATKTIKIIIIIKIIIMRILIIALTIAITIIK